MRLDIHGKKLQFYVCKILTIFAHYWPCGTTKYKLKRLLMVHMHVGGLCIFNDFYWSRILLNKSWILYISEYMYNPPSNLISKSCIFVIVLWYFQWKFTQRDVMCTFQPFNKYIPLKTLIIEQIDISYAISIAAYIHMCTHR